MGHGSWVNGLVLFGEDIRKGFWVPQLGAAATCFKGGDRSWGIGILSSVSSFYVTLPWSEGRCLYFSGLRVTVCLHAKANQDLHE